MRKVYLIACTVFLSQLLFAQNFIDIASVSSQFSSGNKYDNSEDKADLNYQKLNLTIPKLLKSGNIMMFGLTADQLSIASEYDVNRMYYSTMLQFGYQHKFSEKWTGLIMALPQLSSDMEEIDANDFRFGGICIMTYNHLENLKYKIGLYANQEFFGPLIIPVFGLNWQVNDRLQLYGNLPITATAMYKINDKISSGIYFNANTWTYRHFEQGFDYYLQRSTQEISLFLDYYLSRNIVLNLKAGHTIGRSFRLYNEDDKIDAKFLAFYLGDNRNQFNDDFADGLIFEVKLSYRLHFADMDH